MKKMIIVDGWYCQLVDCQTIEVIDAPADAVSGAVIFPAVSGQKKGGKDNGECR